MDNVAAILATPLAFAPDQVEIESNINPVELKSPLAINARVDALDSNIVTDAAAYVFRIYPFVARPPTRPFTLRFESSSSLTSANITPLPESLIEAIAEIKALLTAAETKEIKSLDTAYGFNYSSNLTSAPALTLAGTQSLEISPASLLMSAATCLEFNGDVEFNLDLLAAMEHAVVREGEANLIALKPNIILSNFIAFICSSLNICSMFCISCI